MPSWSRSSPHPYVSRGGIKLAAALDHYGIDVTGRVCLDVGASTGGFSEVLLLRGAKRIYAVDVGHGQLHASLQSRSEIVSLEKTDIRSLAPSTFVERPDLATVDVSFISLKLVLPPIANLLQPTAAWSPSSNPNMRSDASHVKKGIVRNASARAAACEDIAASLRGQGWRVSQDHGFANFRAVTATCEYFIEAQRG